MTDLIGSCANICGELPESGMINGAVFKQVVEGSQLRTEFKGKDGFSFTPECAHWFASNFLPVSRDTSMGFIRRWLILEFDRVVRHEDKVDNLAEIWWPTRREAIAAWALGGLRRLLNQRRYTEPALPRRASGPDARANNSVQAFLEDSKSVFVVPDKWALAEEVYTLYGDHLRAKHNSPVSFERFLGMVEDLDLVLDRDQHG
jgi:phage/plasmid-associated DNA primase